MSDMASPRSIRSSSNKKALHSSSAWIDNDMSESLLGLYTQDEVDEDEDGSGNYQFSSADHSSDMPDNYLFSSSSQTSRLNDINYLNVAAYIANVTVASLFGAWGIDDASDASGMGAHDLDTNLRLGGYLCGGTTPSLDSVEAHGTRGS
eukprot:scaffold47215_cov51-Attheya_sp.AAC.1